MAIQARLADGRVLNFPDGTDPEVINRTVKNLLAPAKPAETSSALQMPEGDDYGTSLLGAEEKPERKVYTGSVFDTQPFDPKFDPVEAEKLSRRAYAEKVAEPPRRTQSMRATPEDQIDRSVGRAIADTGIGLLQGAVSIPKGIASNINAGDNPVAKFYEEAIQAGERSKSPFLQSQKAQREALLENVLKNQGELAQTRAAFTSMFSPSGADVVAQGAGSMLPTVGMSLFGLGQKAFIATNALANAGEAAQNTARELSQMSPQEWSKSDAYQDLRANGLSHADAVRMLAPLLAMPSQLVGGGAGALSGATGLEKSLVGGAIKGGAKERAARAGAELLGEQIETLAPSLAGNITQRMIDEQTSLTEDLGREAVETLFGSTPGAALAATGRSAPDTPPELDTRGLADRMARERGFLTPTTRAERPASAERPAPVQERVEPTFEPEKLAAEPSAPKQPAQEGRDLSDLDDLITQLRQPAVEPTMEKPAPEVAEVAATPTAPVEPAEAAPAEDVGSPLKQRYDKLSSRRGGMQTAVRDRVITDAEYSRYLNQLNQAREAYEAENAAAVELTPLQEEASFIADKLEEAGFAGIARGMRLNIKKNILKTPESLDFYRNKLQEATQVKEQARKEGIAEDYSLSRYYNDEDSRTTSPEFLIDYRAKAPQKVRMLTDEAESLMQQLAGRINAAGFKVNDITAITGKDLMPYKRMLSELAGGASGVVGREAGVRKKYKNSNPESFKKAQESLRRDIEAARVLLEEEAPPLDYEALSAEKAPVSPEVEELLTKQRLANEDIGILSKRSSGTSLMKVLEGSLADGEMSELAGKARKIGKNPFISLVAKKGKRGSSMEDMVDSGKLDIFLPIEMRPGQPTHDNADAAEYIREKLRNGEFYTDDIRNEIENIQRGIWAIEEEIQQELSLEDINREIQYAVDEQRALDQETAELAPEGALEALDEGTREEDELLKSQTKEELKAKQDEIDRLSKENERLSKEAERKAKADEEAGDFALTGSDRVADKAAARGQKDIFAKPAEEPGTTVDENDTGFIGASDEEVADVAEAFDLAAKRQDYDKVTRVFDAPEKGEIVRVENKTKEAIKESGYMTVKQAKQRIEEWKKNAQSQSGSRANSEKVVLSLFDTTGEWSKPWEEAGYQVYRFDIQDDPEFGDVNKFSSEFFNDLFGAFEGQDVYAILAACPCTDFASSGARHFAAKDADGRTVESVKLVQQTLATVEYFKPSVWAIENPVGRIEKLTGLPPWRLSFNPNHFGDPYTKKTLLWGRFNADLPIAPVEPTEGSKMHRMYGGKSQATKNARSVTPEGFAYAFFDANNAIDNPVMAVANKYDMLDRKAVEAAVDAKMTDQEIADVVDDPYYMDLDYDAASAALQEAAESDEKPMLAAETGATGYNISAEDQRIEKELTGKSMIQASDWAVANAPNAFAKVIAEKVRNRLREFQRKGMTLEFNISGGSTRPMMLSGARGITQFEWGKDDKGTNITVTLNGAAVMDNQAGYPPGVQYNTILHELLHVATRSQFVFMPSTDPLKKQMLDLFNLVADRFNADAKAGTLPPVMEKYYKRMNNVLSDQDELLAWGLTDKEVQAYLDDIKVGEKSILTKLVELIRKALGLGKPYESALERLVRTSESMLDVNVDAIDAMLGQRDKQIGVKRKPAGPMTQESLFQKEGAPAKAPPTDSAAFKRWFGDSKVVDGYGKPLVMYHGTNKSQNGEAFTQFDTYGSNYGLMGQGSYFTAEPMIASEYTRKGRGDSPTVYPVYLSIKNPIDMDAKADPDAWMKQFPDAEAFHEGGDTNESWYRATEEAMRDAMVPAYEGAEAMQSGLRSMGYDGIKHVGGGRVGNNDIRHRVYIAFDPEQIKSATGNIGTYDPENPDIRYQREVEEAPKKEPKKLGDTWLLGRDKAGNVGFGPGAKAYSAIAGIANTVLDKMAMKPVSPELGRAMRNMKARVDQVQNKIGEVAAEMNKLSKDEREMISDIIEGELKADVHPPQHVLNLAASIQSMMSRQSRELVELGMLSKEAANRWENKYLPRFYETKLRDEVSAWAKATKDLFKKQPMMRGIKGSQLRARGLFEVIDTKDLPDYLDMGWEQRDPEFNPKTSDSTIVWRDYNRAERENMGEIRDAMFRFVMGYNASQRDIALGRLYKDLADNYASKFPLEGYVQVPETKAEGTQTPRYGKLEGLYVPKEVMDHLSANDEAMANGILKLYRAGLSKWKEGKTVLNPVSHANNVISNLTMAHFAGVSYWDAFKYAGAVKDFVTKSKMVKEAQDVGVFGGSFNNSELVKSMPPELKAMANMTESRLSRFGERIWDTLAFTIEAKGTKYGARPVMQWAYEGEDMFFRYLIYRDARGRGMSPEDARDYSQEYIFTYDDLPKGARAVRDYGMPFFSYTYKVVPVLARTALVYPWRYAAPATIAYTVNAMMYAIAANMGGSDDDWWTTTLYRYMTDEDFRNKAKALESEERKLLPEWMKGQSAILSTPKAIRMGMDEATNLPMFLDISRIFPGGDLLDANNNAGGVALLQPLTPSNPVLTTLVAILANRDMFLGKDVVNKMTDTDAEKAQKRAAWLWKQMTPAISVGNYHFDRAMSTIANMTGEPITIDAGPMGTVSYTGIGKDRLPVQPKHAMLQTMGIKIRPYDLELSQRIEESSKKQAIRELDLQITSINRREADNVITSEAAQIERDKLLKKRDFVSKGLTPDGKEKK